ncbi:MAG: ABC transporter ATP-binding protein [Phycisphaerae bacterium]
MAAAFERNEANGDGRHVVEIRGVAKTFRDFWLRPRVKAVDALDLSVRRGEVLGLLGPNGSGKSTTIKMILGLLFPTKGQISVFGKPPTDVGLKRRIGYLPEDSHLYRFLNAEETLDFYARLFGIPAEERRRRIDMLLEMVGLSSARFRLVGEYSKGMQRRVGLAQALINDPDLLILDEPTTGMDPIAARQIKDLILTLRNRGKTIILCTHLLGEVEDVADRLAIMYGGKLRQLGETNELLKIQGTQTIETDALPEAVLDRIKAVLAEANVNLRDVKVPRQKLETLFLSVIEQSQREGITSTGAEHGGRMADFLQEPEPAGRSLLDELARPEQPPKAAEPETEPEPETNQVQAEVLAEMTRPAGTPEQPVTPAEPAERTPAAAADDDFLRSLTAENGADDSDAPPPQDKHTRQP